ncbi:MAG: Glu-tRNA(Gln) amidotransferase GatDE subunit E, partial [Candidatus Zixiibacteriota bacterium]
SDRLKVIACLERPNMVYDEQAGIAVTFERVKTALKAKDGDAQVLLWADDYDISTALETIEERCLMAFEGVPNETRKSFADGTTIFERVLPGPDRMYPDTDSAPLAIEQERIEEKKKNLPPEVYRRFEQLRGWNIPEDTFPYLLKNNLMPMIEKIVGECEISPKFVGTFFGHTVKHIEGKKAPAVGFTYNKIYGLFKFIKDKKLDREITKKMLPVLYDHPNMEFDSILTTIDYKKQTLEQILSYLPVLKDKFCQIKTSPLPTADLDWIMGNLRKLALGNVPLKDLKVRIEKEIDHD